MQWSYQAEPGRFVGGITLKDQLSGQKASALFSEPIGTPGSVGTLAAALKVAGAT